MQKPLLYLLFGVLIAAGAYYGTTLYMGDLRVAPFRTRTIPPAWPLPATRDPHPFWPRFPDLRSRDAARRDAALRALLGLEKNQLPHPARKPKSWNPALRRFAHALLWRLYRGLSYRTQGLEFRLEKPVDGPLRAGLEARLRIVVENIRGIPGARFPSNLDRLVAAGARVYVITRPAGKVRIGSPPTPAARADKTGDSLRFLGAKTLTFAPLDRAVFPESGDFTVVVAADLVDVKGIPAPRGILVSNPLRIRVDPGEGAGAEAPSPRREDNRGR